MGRTGIWLGVEMESFPADQLEALSRDLEVQGEVEVCWGLIRVLCVLLGPVLLWGRSGSRMQEFPSFSAAFLPPSAA